MSVPITQVEPANDVRTVILADLVEELVADAEAAHTARQNGQPRGPITKLPSIDEVLGGFLAPGVHLVQAAPGAGKTAFCLQVATECGFPALYVTTEMPPLELFRRVICRTTNCYLNEIKTGKLPPGAVQEKAVRAARHAPELAILDGTLGYASPGDHVLPMAEALRNRFQAKNILVIVDSLQVWARSSGVDATEYDLVNAGLRGAKDLASRLACPVLCVSHRNRQGQKTGGIHAAKGSGDLEYAAESVIELTLGKAGFDHMTDVTLGIHKNRHGVQGIEFQLEFEGRLQKFIDAG